MNYEQIVKDNEKLIWKISQHFYGIPKEDLFQAGVLGLLKALKNYKSDSSTKFSTYAHDYIFGEMYLLSSNRNIKISKDILKLYKKIETSRYILAQKIGKIPNNLELSEVLGLDLFTLEEALMSAKTIMSLDNATKEDRDAYEIISAPEYDIDSKILIDDSFKVLSNDERLIIKSRYYEDLTQQEVARKLKMTQVMVSRYEKKGIEKMKEYIML